MDMTGEFRIPAPRQRVWEALNDPQVLKECIPGCQTIEKTSDTEFAARVVAKVGPVQAAFSGKVALSDLDPPKAYTISGEGTGGVAGFAKGAAKVRLDEDGDATMLRYEVSAHVGGKLAQIGSRLIDATARKMAADFFGRFAGQMAPAEIIPHETTRVAAVAPAPVEAGEIPATARAAEAPQPTAAPEAPPVPPAASFRLPPAVWVTGLAIVVALMLYYFTRHGSSGG
jgi:carbon monoxide dehydrogenase subunit G